MRFSVFTAASVALHVAIAAALVRTAAPPKLEAPASSATLAGDTFDVDEPGDGDEQEAYEADPTPATATAPPPEPGTDPSPAPKPTARPSKPARERHAAASPGAPSPPVTAFGAVGERGAVDLPTAFTRAFPQAASADPAWTHAPFGSAGDAELTLTLDDAGKLVSTTISPGTPATLKTGIARTVALIRGRAFTAAGARTRLRISAHVSPDQVHDGLHGDVFALGGSFTSGQGNAFFALAIGRRVDLRITTR